jgi:hypothetical protein
MSSIQFSSSCKLFSSPNILPSFLFLTHHIARFDAKSATLRPVYKRWSRERSPPELYNHGFENMESVGAVYSRISSYILGDWNACGKVMGLAPWAGKSKADAEGWYFSDKVASQLPGNCLEIA